MVIKILTKLLWRRMEDHCENFSKEIQNTKKRNQSNIKNTMSKVKTTLEGINHRSKEAEEWDQQLKERVKEVTPLEDQKTRS